MDYNDVSKTDWLRTLYKAHETIADINRRVEALYTSATSISPLNDGMPKSPNPQRFEGIMVEIVSLKDMAKMLLKKRAIFDLFVCSLSYIERSVLEMRCEECKTWKEVATGCDMSSDTVERIFKRVCEKAEERGLFDKLLDDNAPQ